MSYKNIEFWNQVLWRDIPKIGDSRTFGYAIGEADKRYLEQHGCEVYEYDMYGNSRTQITRISK